MKLADAPLLNSLLGEWRVGNYSIFKDLVQALFKKQAAKHISLNKNVVTTKQARKKNPKSGFGEKSLGVTEEIA